MSTKLFVRNANHREVQMSKEMLIEAFEVYGNFRGVKIKNRGECAYVYFSRSENAEEAMATLNEKPLYGTFLKVSSARVRKPTVVDSRVNGSEKASSELSVHQSVADTENNPTDPPGEIDNGDEHVRATSSGCELVPTGISSSDEPASTVVDSQGNGSEKASKLYVLQSVVDTENNPTDPPGVIANCGERVRATSSGWVVTVISSSGEPDLK